MKWKKFLKKTRDVAVVTVLGAQSLIAGGMAAQALTLNDVNADMSQRRETHATIDGVEELFYMAPIYGKRGLAEELLFCVDIRTPVENGTGYESNPFLFNRKANLVSSLWQHVGVDWNTYFVAQEMLYNEMGEKLDSIEGISVAERTRIKEQINQYITAYEKQPSFHKQTVKMKLGESVTLTDTEGSLLSQFNTEATNTANINYVIDGNKIVLTADKNANKTGVLELEKDLEAGTPYLWKKANSQDLISKGVWDPADFLLNFEIDTAIGQTTIKKYDKATGTTTPLNPNYPMDGAKYGLFMVDETLVKEVELDESKSATVAGLELGSYYWQETKAPIGYTLDSTKHPVELTFENIKDSVVVNNTVSEDEVIQMNLDGQKLIQNNTNEMFKNGVEFTMTNKRTGEQETVATNTVNGKVGYFNFSKLALDNYVLEETKGVEGYQNIDPIEINHSYDAGSDSFTFVVKDQKNGNILNQETYTQEELANGAKVDLGSYIVTNKAIPVEKPKVSIRTRAHTGDGKSNTFVWGEEVTFFDDTMLNHENIPAGSKRSFEVKLHANYKDAEGKVTTEIVWKSGQIGYEVTDKEMMERAKSAYNYLNDPKADKNTDWFFSEDGYNENGEKDTEHNTDGTDPDQTITPVFKELPTTPTTPNKPEGSLPSTGEQVMKGATVLGLLVVAGVLGTIYLKRKKVEATEEDTNKMK